MLLDPEEQAFQQDWEASVADFIAAFRRNLGDDVTHPRAVALVGELSLVSAHFRSLWARHDVGALPGNTLTVRHPTVGQLTLHRDKLPVDDKLLVGYHPDTGSDAADKLHLLALSASPQREGRAPDTSDTPGR